ncbi:MAG: hemolysin III family protein [Geminicoccaceae bacterium]
MDFPQYSSAERFADGVVHIVGVTFGVVASAILLTLAIEQSDITYAMGHGVYIFGILAMLVCSALYNMWWQGPLKAFFRRLDHAAIFLAIAGTYTPFALISIGGSFGQNLLIYVWSVATLGILFKLIWPTRWEALSIAVYLLLGWTIVFAIDPLVAAVSMEGFILLVAGGLLYSVGVIFYRWTSLPYQNAIWHGFVLAAASCHFAVVIFDTALKGQ